MPHPKGSKNKVTRSKAKGTAVNTYFDALIVENDSVKENLTAENTSLEENPTALKVILKAKKADLITVNKKIAKLEEQKTVFYAA